MSYLVFISHAGADNWIAERVANDVGTCAEVFLDERNIFAGDQFEVEILNSIRAADELWVLLTPNSIGRPYVWLEIGAAWARNIRVVGIVFCMSVTQISNEPGIPVFLKQTTLVDSADRSAYKTLLNDLSRRSEEIVSRAVAAGT